MTDKTLVPHWVTQQYVTNQINLYELLNHLKGHMEHAVSLQDESPVYNDQKLSASYKLLSVTVSFAYSEHTFKDEGLLLDTSK